MGAGEGEDEVVDLRMKSRARTAAAARHALRKVHMVLTTEREDRLNVARAAVAL